MVRGRWQPRLGGVAAEAIMCLTLPRCDELRSSDFGGFEVTVTSKSVLTVYFHMGGLYFMLQ
jgi:hypothetical protein